MMGYVPDNYDQFVIHDGRLAYAEKKRPECGWCGKKIFTSYGYQIEGEMVCPKCMEEWMRDHEIDIEED